MQYRKTVVETVIRQMLQRVLFLMHCRSQNPVQVSTSMLASPTEGFDVAMHTVAVFCMFRCYQQRCKHRHRLALRHSMSL